jgi:hypothetical protein
MVSDRKPSKGRVTRRIIFLKTKKLNQYFYKCAPSMRQWFFTFFSFIGCLIKSKINTKYQLAFLKRLQIVKNFYFGFLLYHYYFSPV